MNRTMWNGLVRRMDQAKVAGVCSGLAVHFGWKLGGVRLAMLALCCFAPPLGFGLYIAGALLLPALEANGTLRPAMFGQLLQGSGGQYAGVGAWQSTPPPPPSHGPGFGAASLQVPVSDAQARLRDLEQRLREIEAFMTSSRYEFDRELRSGR